MKPILIHCHIFYSELWKELKQCILNVSPYPFELYVTMVEKHPNLERDIRKTFPKAHLEVVANRGYDIGPFVHILNKVNLDKYSYVIKLHTKRDMRRVDIGFRRMHSSIWRENLLQPFKSSELFKKYMDCFESNPQVGMQANYKLIVHHDIYDNEAQKAMKNWLKKHHLPKIKYAFVGGTMFIVQAHLFKFFQNLNIQLSDFPEPKMLKNYHESQLAHIMERLFGYCVYYQGYIVADSDVSFLKRHFYYALIVMYQLVQPTFNFFFQKKVTKSGRLTVKILKIPVYWRKV